MGPEDLHVLTGSKLMLMLLVKGPQFENQSFHPETPMETWLIPRNWDSVGLGQNQHFAFPSSQVLLTQLRKPLLYKDPQPHLSFREALLKL